MTSDVVDRSAQYAERGPVTRFIRHGTSYGMRAATEKATSPQRLRLANVPAFSGEGQREREARATAFVRCNTLLARLATGGTSLPDAGILLGVHDRDDEDNTRIHPIEDRVRKAFDESSAKIPIDDGSNFGARLNFTQRDAEMITKPLA